VRAFLNRTSSISASMWRARRSRSIPAGGATSPCRAIATSSSSTRRASREAWSVPSPSSRRSILYRATSRSCSRGSPPSRGASSRTAGRSKARSSRSTGSLGRVATSWLTTWSYRSTRGTKSEPRPTRTVRSRCRESMRRTVPGSASSRKISLGTS
jgi:hypothetical protein